MRFETRDFPPHFLRDHAAQIATRANQVRHGDKFAIRSALTPTPESPFENIPETVEVQEVYLTCMLWNDGHGDKCLVFDFASPDDRIKAEDYETAVRDDEPRRRAMMDAFKEAVTRSG